MRKLLLIIVAVFSFMTNTNPAGAGGSAVVFQVSHAGDGSNNWWEVKVENVSQAQIDQIFRSVAMVDGPLHYNLPSENSILFTPLTIQQVVRVSEAVLRLNGLPGPAKGTAITPGYSGDPGDEVYTLAKTELTSGTKWALVNHDGTGKTMSAHQMHDELHQLLDDSNDTIGSGLTALSLGLGALGVAIFGAGFLGFLRAVRKKST